MSTPSITLRIDLGDSGAASGAPGAALMHGEAPQPTASMSSSHFAGTNADAVPSPMAGFAHAASEGAVPTPMSGIGATSAAFSAAPVPTLDPTAAFGGEATGEPPKPEGEPGDAKKVAGKR